MLIAIFNLGGPFVRWPRRPAYLPWMQLKLEMLAKPSQLTADPGAITEKLWNRDDPGTYINTSSWWHIWSRKQSAACTKHTNRLCVIRSLMLLKVLKFFGRFRDGSPILRTQTSQTCEWRAWHGVRSSKWQLLRQWSHRPSKVFKRLSYRALQSKTPKKPKISQCGVKLVLFKYAKG